MQYCSLIAPFKDDARWRGTKAGRALDCAVWHQREVDGKESKVKFVSVHGIARILHVLIYTRGAYLGHTRVSIKVDEIPKSGVGGDVTSMENSLPDGVSGRDNR